MNIYKRSIDIILENQSPSGAYIASPNFPTYAYCWLRDGSYIAHAMNMVGEHDSAKKYFYWVIQVIESHADKVERVLDKQCRGEELGANDFLHTRFTLDGCEASGEWENFQLDGYGTWLWALVEYMNMTGDQKILGDAKRAVGLTIDYLAAIWNYPNYDCWEENPHAIHTYSLAAIFAGFSAVNQLQSEHNLNITSLNMTLKSDAVQKFLFEKAVFDGRLVKQILVPSNREDSSYRVDSSVDASLIGVSVPFGMLSPSEVLMTNTIEQIERDLHPKGGGVYRYAQDTFFGGGEWVLLAAWLGWYYVSSNKRDKARELFKWVEGQANMKGELPEQVSDHILFPKYYPVWVKKWGPIANPLLWSHAMYLILYEELSS